MTFFLSFAGATGGARPVCGPRSLTFCYDLFVLAWPSLRARALFWSGGGAAAAERRSGGGAREAKPGRGREAEAKGKQRLCARVTVTASRPRWGSRSARAERGRETPAHTPLGRRRPTHRLCAESRFVRERRRCPSSRTTPPADAALALQEPAPHLLSSRHNCAISHTLTSSRPTASHTRVKKRQQSPWKREKLEQAPVEEREQALESKNAKERVLSRRLSPPLSP